MPERLLDLRGISKSFGGLACITELDLHVDENEIVSVIGPNGAGKTTLFNLITGVYAPDAGEIEFAGESLLGLEPHQIVGRGVARTFQSLRLFLNMTVKENVMAAAYSHTRAGIFRSILRTPGMRREEKAINALAEERLSFFGQRLMGYRWNQPAYSLSYANRRRLEIARATATNPRLLLLDEPAAGMNPAETHEITELIAKLRNEGGYTVLVIEHDMHVVEGISDLAEERLAFFGERLMGYRWNQPAYSLSYANRRRLEIARATATMPKMLLLDEPAAGMNPVETHEITELIARLRDEAGYTILVI